MFLSIKYLDLHWHIAFSLTFYAGNGKIKNHKLSGGVMLDKGVINQVAYLARIKLKDEELKKLSLQLEHILAFIDKLKRADIEGVAPTSHAIDVKNCFREDIPLVGLTAEKALVNAPSKANNFFLVPKVIE